MAKDTRQFVLGASFFLTTFLLPLATMGRAEGFLGKPKAQSSKELVPADEQFGVGDKPPVVVEKSPDISSENTESSRTSFDRHAPRMTAAVLFGAQQFHLAASVGTPADRWMCGELRGVYESTGDELQRDVSYGPEALVGLMLSNRTPITPFAKAGPGHRTWERQKVDALTTRGSGVTGVTELGVNMALTDRFGLEFVARNLAQLTGEVANNDSRIVRTRQFGFAANF